MNDHGTCGNCRFGFKQDGVPTIQCRYGPPAPLFLGMQQDGTPLIGQQVRAQPIVMAYFPSLMPEFWCGKWEPSKEGIN